MSRRKLVIQHIEERMAEAFNRGNFVDAQNMYVFITTLEELSDDDYDVLADEAEEQASGVIS